MIPFYTVRHLAGEFEELCCFRQLEDESAALYFNIVHGAKVRRRFTTQKVGRAMRGLCAHRESDRSLWIDRRKRNNAVRCLVIEQSRMAREKTVIPPPRPHWRVRRSPPICRSGP